MARIRNGWKSPPQGGRLDSGWGGSKRIVLSVNRSSACSDPWLMDEFSVADVSAELLVRNRDSAASQPDLLEPWLRVHSWMYTQKNWKRVFWTHSYHQLIFDKSTKAKKWGKGGLQSMMLGELDIHMQKTWTDLSPKKKDKWPPGIGKGVQHH